MFKKLRELGAGVALMVMSGFALAQTEGIPTTVPTEVQAAIDNGGELVVAIGMAMLIFLITVTVVRWVRGAAS